MKLSIHKNKLSVKTSIGRVEIAKGASGESRLCLFRSGVVVICNTHPLNWYPHKRELKKYALSLARKWLNPKCRLVEYTVTTKTDDTAQLGKVDKFHYIQPRNVAVEEDYATSHHAYKFRIID